MHVSSHHPPAVRTTTRVSGKEIHTEHHDRIYLIEHRNPVKLAHVKDAEAGSKVLQASLVFGWAVWLAVLLGWGWRV